MSTLGLPLLQEIVCIMNEPKDPRMSGKIAMYVLIFIAALVGLMIWVAG